MPKNDLRLANFLFEIGTMRKLMRIHRQPLLADDMSDNIASHSYRVAIIGWILAKKEKVDPYKVVMMCLLHDTQEARSNDHNWIHRKYVKVFEDEIIKDQLGDLPFKELESIASEYEYRKTKESIIAKEADKLDQLLLLKEYEQQGNKEAQIWLKGKKGKQNAKLKDLKLKSSMELGKAIYKTSPSAWWSDVWTSKERR